MKLINSKDNTMADSNEQNQGIVRRLRHRSPTIERNKDTEALNSVRNNVDADVKMPEPDEEPINIIKQYHGREWSEVEHLLQVPDLEKEDDEEEYEWSPEPSQLSNDSNDDPFVENIHDIVNVLDNVIRSQSNLRCDATRVVEYLDLDLFKYETILSEVQNWTWDSEDFFDDDPFTSSELDIAP